MAEDSDLFNIDHDQTYVFGRDGPPRQLIELCEGRFVIRTLPENVIEVGIRTNGKLTVKKYEEWTANELRPLFIALLHRSTLLQLAIKK